MTDACVSNDLLGWLREELRIQRDELAQQHARLLSDFTVRSSVGVQAAAAAQPDEDPVTSRPAAAEPEAEASLLDFGGGLEQVAELADPPAEACAETTASHHRNSRVHISEQKNPNVGTRSLADIMHHPVVEGFFALLIVLNAVVMCVEMQYKGFHLGHVMGYKGMELSAAETWPGAANIFYLLGSIFGMVFTAEVILKVVALRLKFVLSGWNWFDLVIAVSWLVDYISNGRSIGISPMLLRLARLARVMRILRLVRFVHSFDALQLLISSIAASVSILVWSTAILFMIMVICAILLNHLLFTYMEEPDSEFRGEVFRYFGTWTRAMVTMFEITLGNWVPVCRLLSEHVNEAYGAAFLLYKVSIGFAVVKVITGVFMHETFKVASSDDELMIIQKERLVEKHRAKMETLFAETDSSNDGKLSLPEFRQILGDHRVKFWLAAMDLDVRDSELLFRLIDGAGTRDGCISAEELVTGVAQLMGPARSIDMAVALQDVKYLKAAFAERFGEIEAVSSHLVAVRQTLEEFGLSMRKAMLPYNKAVASEFARTDTAPDDVVLAPWSSTDYPPSSKPEDMLSAGRGSPGSLWRSARAQL